MPEKKIATGLALPAAVADRRASFLGLSSGDEEPAGEVSQKSVLAGFGRTQEDLEHCLEEYESLNVWFVNDSRTIIRFVEGDE